MCDGISGGIRGSPEDWVMIKTLCHENATLGEYDGTRLVKVVFVSDFSVTRTGFSGKATAREYKIITK